MSEPGPPPRPPGPGTGSEAGGLPTAADLDQLEQELDGVDAVLVRLDEES